METARADNRRDVADCTSRAVARQTQQATHFMAHPSLVILGYSEAAMFLRGTPPPNVRAIISVHGPREFGVEAALPHRLDLGFDDVDVPAEGDIDAIHRAAARKQWAEQN